MQRRIRPKTIVNSRIRQYKVRCHVAESQDTRVRAPIPFALPYFPSLLIHTTATNLHHCFDVAIAALAPLIYKSPSTQQQPLAIQQRTHSIFRTSSSTQHLPHSIFHTSSFHINTDISPPPQPTLLNNSPTTNHHHPTISACPPSPSSPTSQPSSPNPFPSPATYPTTPTQTPAITPRAASLASSEAALWPSSSSRRFSFGGGITKGDGRR